MVKIYIGLCSPKDYKQDLREEKEDKGIDNSKQQIIQNLFS